MNTPIEYARFYIGLGWKVFPVWNVIERDGVRVCVCGRADCDRPGKHPVADYVPGGLNDASKERGDIERWWGARPDMNIGIRTGRDSGISVIDADVTGGKPGLVNLTTVCAANGGVPDTLKVNTGGGGLHLYFKHSEALPTGTNVLGEAIDVRNDGGYVIAPPSSHMLGVYKWADEQRLYRVEPRPLLDLPAWMRPTAGSTGVARGRGRPRTRASLRIEKTEDLLKYLSSDDRDVWLKIGVILGRLYLGTPGESEAWGMYEAWSARSEKFDENRAENLARMREMFYEQSQAAPRAGQEPLGPGSLFAMAKDGGWTPYGNRVPVPYEPGNEAAMCTQLVAALTTDSETNRFFAVGAVVHEVLRGKPTSVQVHYRSVIAGHDLPKGLIVRMATPSAIQSALSSKAVLAMTNRNGEPIAKPIPSELAQMILKAHGGEFPSLTGIAGWPLVLAGQVLHRSRGYDADSGLYFDIDPAVRLDESREPQAAWQWIRDELLADFPFESDTHKAGALSLLLALMLRPVMKTCPAFAVVAPQPGTGKSTLIEACAIAVHGSAIAVQAFSSDEEERRKVLHALMMAKIPAVMFDNIGRGTAVSSDHLAKIITSENSTDRVLGHSEISTAANSVLLTFTGNNISFVKDLASRVVTIRLNVRQANPFERSFRREDVRAWALEHRSEVLSALLSIAKLGDGRRPPGSASRFEDYDRMIVAPVLAVTGEDVRKLNVTEALDAEELEATHDVLGTLWKWQQLWRGEENGKPWSARELAAALVDGTVFPSEKKAEIQRWATPDERKWTADPVRVLSYALRAARDDHGFYPYVLVNEHVREGHRRWLVRNAEAQVEGAPGAF